MDHTSNTLLIKRRLVSPHGCLHFNIAGRKNLVISVLTAQAIYPLTVVDVPVEPLDAIVKICRDFFWAGSDKDSGGQCKVSLGDGL
jgi:hypothetical protein